MATTTTTTTKRERGSDLGGAGSDDSIDTRPARRRRIAPSHSSSSHRSIDFVSDRSLKVQIFTSSTAEDRPADFVSVGKDGEPSSVGLPPLWENKGKTQTHIANLSRAKDLARRRRERSRSTTALLDRHHRTDSGWTATPPSPSTSSAQPHTPTSPRSTKFSNRTPRRSRVPTRYLPPTAEASSCSDADQDRRALGVSRESESETETEWACLSGEEVEMQTRTRDWPDSPSPVRSVPMYHPASPTHRAFAFGARQSHPFTYASIPLPFPLASSFTSAALCAPLREYMSPRDPSSKARAGSRMERKPCSPTPLPTDDKRSRDERQRTPEGHRCVRTARVVMHGEEEVLRRLDQPIGRSGSVEGGSGAVGQAKEALARVGTWEVERIGMELGLSSLKANRSLSDMEISDSELGRLIVLDRARELTELGPSDSFAIGARGRMKARDLVDARRCGALGFGGDGNVGTGGKGPRDLDMSMSFARRIAVKRHLARVGNRSPEVSMLGYSLMDNVAIARAPMAECSIRELYATRSDTVARNDRRRSLMTSYQSMLAARGIDEHHFADTLRRWSEAHASDPGYMAVLHAFREVKQTAADRRARASEEAEVEDVLMVEIIAATEVDLEDAPAVDEELVPASPASTSRLTRSPSVDRAEPAEAMERYRPRRRIDITPERRAFIQSVDTFVDKMERRMAQRGEERRLQRAAENAEAIARRDRETREASQREAYISVLQRQAEREREEMRSRAGAEEADRIETERLAAIDRREREIRHTIDAVMRGTTVPPMGQSLRSPVPSGPLPPRYSLPTFETIQRLRGSSMPPLAAQEDLEDIPSPVLTPAVISPPLPNYTGDIYRPASPPPPPPYNATTGFSVINQQEEDGVLDLLDELEEDDEDESEDGYPIANEDRPIAAEPSVPGGNAGLGLGLTGTRNLRIMTLEEMQAEERSVDERERRGTGWWGMLRGIVGL